MPISWNEIRHNAVHFSREWANVRSETAEKQTFWNEFFQVFGIRRRLVASFEERVQKPSGKYAFIDLFWPSTLLVEHKSRGKDLGAAESQAFDYIPYLIASGRQDEAPRYVIVSDFERMALHDLEPDAQLDLPLFAGRRVHTLEFPLSDLHRYIHAFAFIPGYQQHRFEDQDPINLKAVEIMGRLHDALEAGGYSGHRLERFLVRVLFCLFAEDTGIFEREAFTQYITNRSAADGSDLGPHLARLFDVLNTPSEQRQVNLDESLSVFPYVNGDLFREDLGFADFNREMRNALLAASRFDWSRISPAIFGSLFQAVMEPAERRQLGGHYTSERDILKVLRALFLDALVKELHAAGQNKAELRRLHQKLTSLRFLDPACGCGNFLVVAYRELRELEIELLKLLHTGEQRELDIQRLAQMDVDAFYGIEVSEWPARIAEVAMWLVDHQMNVRLSEAFGQYFVRLPLRKRPTIVCGNALRLDWSDVLPRRECSYVLGNPPFVGKKARTPAQQADMELVFGAVPGTKVLDYVTCWYVKAAEYLAGTRATAAFVSTSSITQGEQPGALWPLLFKRGVTIHFAHRTFPWESQARGKAHVHVVIIGFGTFDVSRKTIVDYASGDHQATLSAASNISPYLVDGSDTVLVPREQPISRVPSLQFGNMPNDGGHFLLSDTERQALLDTEPHAERFVRPFVSAREYLHGERRWCVWLDDIHPQELQQLSRIRARVVAVREYRLASKREATQRLASVPTRFGEVRQPDSEYVLIPRHSASNRSYIPLSYFPPTVVVGDSCLFLAGATRYHFGVLSSEMHMAFVRQVCGRIKSDYRYSCNLVYNNFPWPEDVTSKQRSTVEAAAQGVLDARAAHDQTGATLADLYDPIAMPPDLVKAHAALNRSVDLCYRSAPFTSERKRVEHLFALHEIITAPLAAAPKRSRPRRQRS